MKLKPILRKLRTNIQKPFWVMLTSFVLGTCGGIFQTYIFPKFIEKPRFAIKANICSPSKISASFVNTETGKKYPISNGFPAPIYISFENVGASPLTEIDLNIEFMTDKKDFNLQNDTYYTNPPKGFGDVKIEKKSYNERIVKIPIFNPGEKIIYSAMGNYPAITRTYSKTLGLSFFSEKAPSCEF